MASSEQSRTLLIFNYIYIFLFQSSIEYRLWKQFKKGSEQGLFKSSMNLCWVPLCVSKSIDKDIGGHFYTTRVIAKHCSGKVQKNWVFYLHNQNWHYRSLQHKDHGPCGVTTPTAASFVRTRKRLIRVHISSDTIQCSSVWDLVWDLWENKLPTVCLHSSTQNQQLFFNWPEE